MTLRPLDIRVVAYWKEHSLLLPEIETMSSDLVAELLDSGVILKHPELKERIRDYLYANT